MSFSTLFQDVSGFFGLSTASSSTGHVRTLVEVAGAAESDELERMLAEAGIPQKTVDAEAPVRRKWSELQAFDRSMFDHDAYIRSLED